MKNCEYLECSNPVFGGGYCKWHQKHRTDKKLKALNKLSLKAKIKKTKKMITISEDMKFYMAIWAIKKHICYNCNKDLGNIPNLCFFDHILEKSKYPSLRYAPENICILCQDCHSTKTNGILSQKLKDLREKTKKRFLEKQDEQKEDTQSQSESLFE